MVSSGSADDRVAEILKAVANPLRLGILSVLCQGDEHVGALARRLGVKAAAVSQALSLLRAQRLVSVARREKFATYRLEERGLRDLIPCIGRSLGLDGAGRANVEAARTPERPRARRVHGRFAVRGG